MFFSWGVEDTAKYIYRVSNNGETGWRPSVTDIKAFSDEGCKNEIVATYVDSSGHNNRGGDGKAAFDDNPSTSWRPNCHPCGKFKAWATFSTTAQALCVEAENLGKGSAGGASWNSGILIELQNKDETWGTAMESKSGNVASVSTGIISVTVPTIKNYFF